MASDALALKIFFIKKFAAHLWMKRVSNTKKLSYIEKKNKTGDDNKVAVTPDKLKERELNDDVSYFKILSWNVAGLRSVLNCEKKLFTFKEVILKYKPDLFSLQEHKLQEKNAEVKLRMEELFPDYQSFWVFSTVKKGYSGVAVFIKHSGIDLTQLTSTDKQRSITNYAQKNTSPNTSGEHFFLLNKESMPHESFRVISISYPTIQGAQAEGRVVLVELKSCYLFLVYVPNSGVRLERLSYRVEQWDTQLLALLKKYEKRKPVALIGDLNVAHCDIDIYNPTAKHIAKTAGCTREERESFGRLLDNGFVDSFRFFYPESKGHYTYWSQRANNRPYNRGLRLDYSVGSCALFNYDEQEAAGVFIYDSQILSSEGTSVGDHCPILLTLGSKK